MTFFDSKGMPDIKNGMPVKLDEREVPKRVGVRVLSRYTGWNDVARIEINMNEMK